MQHLSPARLKSRPRAWYWNANDPVDRTQPRRAPGDSRHGEHRRPPARAFDRAGRHDGRGQDLHWPPAGGGAGPRLRGRRRRNRDGGGYDHRRDFRPPWRGLFPRRRAPRGLAPAGRGAARRGDGRRRLHESNHTRTHRRARRFPMDQGGSRAAAQARPQAHQPPAHVGGRSGSDDATPRGRALPGLRRSGLLRCLARLSA